MWIPLETTRLLPSFTYLSINHYIYLLSYYHNIIIYIIHLTDTISFTWLTSYVHGKLFPPLDGLCRCGVCRGWCQGAFGEVEKEGWGAFRIRPRPLNSRAVGDVKRARLLRTYVRWLSETAQWAPARCGRANGNGRRRCRWICCSRRCTNKFKPNGGERWWRIVRLDH